MGRRRFIINVNEQDIAKGIRNTSYHCAVSCAIARNIPGAFHVSTDIQTIRFSSAEDGKRFVYLTPQSVQQYVVDFDAGVPLRPFKFALYMPAWQSTLWKRVGASGASGASGARPTEETAIVNTGKGVITVASSSESRRAPRQLTASGKRIYGLRAMRLNLPAQSETP